MSERLGSQEVPHGEIVDAEGQIIYYSTNGPKPEDYQWEEAVSDMLGGD